ncbi:MAG TPA: ABC transporter ATP-binding protein [Clostridiales bacterium]|nr:ABC transporter ATP-binding protein [Clostridiales bacterium]
MTTGLSILGLIPNPPGVIVNCSIDLNDLNLLKKSEKEMEQIRGKAVSMIFQDPMTSLNPTMRIGDQIAEGMKLHTNKSRQEIKKDVLELLDLVKIPNPELRIKQYPHEFSGGMRQRAVIAIALACCPDILIADEPTTALDVTIQAQIMELMSDIKKKLNTSIMLVTHDLGVVAAHADKIQVMYAGKIVERGTVDEIFYNPKHPYTIALLKSVPTLDMKNKQNLYSLLGTPPDLTNPPVGCPFAARCEYGMRICRMKESSVYKFSDTHEAQCWLLHEKFQKAE